MGVEAGSDQEGRLHPLGWVAIAVVVAYNPISNLVLPEVLYVPTNLAAAGLVTWLAHRAGATTRELGVDRPSEGLGLGLAVSGIVVSLVALAAAVPASREFFADQRFVDADFGEALYQMVVRIPLGTAVTEEVIFRSAVFGLFLTRHSILRSAILSSLLFGLWHVIPTLAALETNPAGDLIGGFGGVIGGVLVTFVAGLGFVWLRVRGGGLIAPVLVHAAMNVSAYAAGWWVVNG